jgi:L-lactate dehydrogenase complex protein LldG
MKISPAKENTLKKIRQALTHSTPLPFPQSEGQSPVFAPILQELDIEFAEQFTKLQGRFVFSSHGEELRTQLQNLIRQRGWGKIFCCEPLLKDLLGPDFLPFITTDDLASCDAAITSCESLVARTGSIVMSSAQPSGRTVSVYAPVHLCIAHTSQLVPDIREGLQGLREKYPDRFPSLISFATGPSRTADIEKTLVVGVHGPREVYLFLLDETPLS